VKWYFFHQKHLFRQNIIYFVEYYKKVGENAEYILIAHHLKPIIDLRMVKKTIYETCEYNRLSTLHFYFIAILLANEL